MAKIYAQNVEIFDLTVASLAANASTSGSLPALGYTKALGLFRSDVATETGSGVRLEESPDGTYWTIAGCGITTNVASGAVAACGMIALEANVSGRWVRAVVKNGAAAASDISGTFYLRPI